MSVTTFAGLIDAASKDALLVSSNAIITLCHTRAINAAHYHHLQNSIVTPAGVRSAVAGAYVIESSAKDRFFAVGGNHRTLLLRPLFGSVYVAPIPWTALESVCKHQNLLKFNESLQLTDDVLDRICAAIRELEPGDQGKSISDQVSAFKALVLKYYPRADPGSFKITMKKFYLKVWKKDLHLPDGKLYIYDEEGAVPYSHRINEDILLAEVYNENGKVSSARHLYNGFRHLYNTPDVVGILSEFRIPIHKTAYTLESLGTKTKGQMSLLARAILAVPPDDRPNSDILRKLRKAGPSPEAHLGTGPLAEIMNLTAPSKRGQMRKALDDYCNPLRLEIFYLKNRLAHLSPPGLNGPSQSTPPSEAGPVTNTANTETDESPRTPEISPVLNNLK